MSFENAMQPLQRFVMKKYNTPVFGTILALLAARMRNTTIGEGDVTETGKFRQLKISYYGQQCDVVADTCDNNYCPTGTDQEPVQEWFNINTCIQSKAFRLKTNDIRTVDNDWGFSQHAQQQIASKLGALEAQLDTDLFTLVRSHAGVHLDGNATHRLSMANTASGQLTPIGLFQIQQEFAECAYTMEPFIIGQTEVFRWKETLKIAVPNTYTGLAPEKLGDYNMFYEPRINTILGNPTNEEVLVFNPEALKFVTYNENVGVFATELGTDADFDRMFKRGGTDYAYGVLQSPATGLLWDFNIDFDKCTKAFTYWFKLNYDIYFPRIQNCNPEGVNGIFRYTTCPVVVPTCPTGDAPSPVVNQTTFAWTPTTPTVPLYVANITLGGNVNNNTNVTVATLADYAALLNDITGTGQFSVSGSAIHYTGYSALTGTINGGTGLNGTITFA